VIEKGAPSWAGTAHRVVVRRLEELGGNLLPARRELLVMLVSRLLDPAERHGPGVADDCGVTAPYCELGHCGSWRAGVSRLCCW
jgi:hypothetical protein